MKHPLRGWPLIKDIVNRKMNIFNNSKLGKRFWIIIFLLALIFIVEKSIKVRAWIKARKNINVNSEKEVWS